MEMRLGSKMIQLNKVSRVTPIGSNVADIHFVTGESIRVTCNVEFEYPRSCAITYLGTVEELKAFIERNRN